MKILNDKLKNKLIQNALERKLKDAQAEPSPLATSGDEDIPEEFCRFDQHPTYRQMQIISKGAEQLGVADPFFRVHDGLAGATTSINGKQLINFGNYNYLGLSGHPEVNAAAQQAIDRYGTSVSASRPTAGERPINLELEKALADLYQVDDALVFISGHATNVSTIGHLFGVRDLIIHDELIHNSVVVGAQLSGAKRLSFPHNNLAALKQLLLDNRRAYERVLIVVEGLYSMDGDFPELPELIQLKQEFKCFLMVDEAHSLGVVGATGKGLMEHFDVTGKDVDIWMGTLSKSLAGSGGYIAGETALIEQLKFLAPGFLYSVGMPAQVTAASLAALNIMLREPERVERLKEISEYFLAEANKRELDTGFCQGYCIVPVITGNSIHAAQLSERMLARGINVQPIIYPAVPEKTARLRFFITSAMVSVNGVKADRFGNVFHENRSFAVRTPSGCARSCTTC